MSTKQLTQFCLKKREKNPQGNNCPWEVEGSVDC